MTESCFGAIEPLLGTRTACSAVGRARASHYRRRHQTTPHHRRPRPAPPNKLTAAEAATILDALRSPRFVDCAPAQVLYTLLDEGVYLASESTYYRLLRAHGEVRERRRQATHPAKVKPELIAAGPNIVWSWDITKLKGPRRGEYYDLYLVLDIFSRYVVAWCVAPSESGELAKELIANAVARHQVPPRPAHGARGPWVVDDLEPGGRAAHLPGDRAEPLASAREQRQPLQREPVQDPQVLTSIPGTLRLDPRRPRILRAVLSLPRFPGQFVCRDHAASEAAWRFLS